MDGHIKGAADPSPSGCEIIPSIQPLWEPQNHEIPQTPLSTQGRVPLQAGAPPRPPHPPPKAWIPLTSTQECHTQPRSRWKRQGTTFHATRGCVFWKELLEVTSLGILGGETLSHPYTLVVEKNTKWLE